MVRKSKEQQKAIALRKAGRTYSEILKQVPVAKSTLSLWLRDVGLAVQERQRITEKRVAAQRRGAEARRDQRTAKSSEIFTQSRIEALKFLKDPLFLLGMALYWAEGSKQKDWNVSQCMNFSNMDPKTHKVVLAWIQKYMDIRRNALRFDLYIHETADVEVAKEFWSKELGITISQMKVYFKRAKITGRHNVGRTYHGVLRINVPKSTDLNRRIAGWIEGVIEYAM